MTMAVAPGGRKVRTVLTPPQGVTKVTVWVCSWQALTSTHKALKLAGDHNPKPLCGTASSGQEAARQAVPVHVKEETLWFAD